RETVIAASGERTGLPCWFRRLAETIFPKSPRRRDVVASTRDARAPQSHLRHVANNLHRQPSRRQLRHSEDYMYENTEFSASRDIEAIQIPAATKITSPTGTPGVITQSLGGSDTIATNFGLSRVAEKDGDALGLEKSESQPTASANGVKDGEVSEDDVWNQLRQCYDPEIPVNIVDLGLVYDCKLTKKEDGSTRVDVKMTLTAPGCGMGPAIAHDAQSKILTIDGVDEADVQLVWDP